MLIFMVIIEQSFHLQFFFELQFVVFNLSFKNLIQLKLTSIYQTLQLHLFISYIFEEKRNVPELSTIISYVDHRNTCSIGVLQKRFPRESIFDLRSAKLRLPNGIYSPALQIME